jgi:magnesium-transporting ATPase (P-type)
MPKGFLTEYRLELGSFLVIGFAVLTIVGIIGVFFVGKLPASLSFLEDLSAPFRSSDGSNWAYWMIVVGPIGLAVCIWWVYDYFSKVQKLSRLIDTPSKAKFVRNIDDIDYLAWSLPQRFEDKVLEKKKGFRLNR